VYSCGFMGLGCGGFRMSLGLRRFRTRVCFTLPRGIDSSYRVTIDCAKNLCLFLTYCPFLFGDPMNYRR
jgi:hypothetical protein